MDDILTSLSYSLISNKRFAITSNNPIKSSDKFTNYLINHELFMSNLQDESTTLKSIDSESLNQYENFNFAVIDLLQIDSTIELIKRMIYKKDEFYHLKNLIIWQNLQLLSDSQFKLLYKLILQLDQFEMIENYNNNKIVIEIDKFDNIDTDQTHIEIIKPELFSIVLFLDVNLYSNKIYMLLKEKFWFSIYWNTEEGVKNGIEKVKTKVDSDIGYTEMILKLRNKLDTVFVAPDIKRYIYSLAVFTRCHRLASISPKTVRISTQVIDYVLDLSKVIVLWNNKDQFLSKKQGQISNSTVENQELYVTPTVVKTAFKKVCYWLVDWEYNKQFLPKQTQKQETESTDQVSEVHQEQDKLSEYNKQLQIAFLTGDWYGCDYYYVDKYLKKHENELKRDSSTGYTNKLIDDVLNSVRPPL
ncbi:unnamed protein product [Candida verbasci]|uniref:Uncharacterized protein n=1 Tax=Candida verbasci TaxID=1227364 RepID=A0A9W4U0R6_9ASCO|nr:unnamed protein product [Candida verbasci]